MTEQEAIVRLQDHFRVHDDGRPTPLLDEACVVAYKALEKQIPKKPINNVEYPSCPNCNHAFYWGCIDKYCTECGQALKWE